LYKKIREWRDQKAREMNLPHYMVLPQTTIVTMANYLPLTLQSLKQIKGLGKKKLEKYADELLTMITGYCREYNVKPDADGIPETSPPKTWTDSKLASLNLYREGKTIAQIADERDMAESTIEGHLAHYVGTGEIPIGDFVSTDITALIASHFEGQGDFQLGPVKAALGERVSWSEIRFVLKHLEFTRTIQKDLQKS